MAPVLDIDAFWERVGEDGALARELIAMYFEEEPKQAGAVRAAVLAKDAEALKQAAHAVKGTVANFSAAQAMQAAAVLEKMGLSGDLSGVDEACEHLDHQLVLLRSALAKFEK